MRKIQLALVAALVSCLSLTGRAQAPSSALPFLQSALADCASRVSTSRKTCLGDITKAIAALTPQPSPAPTPAPTPTPVPTPSPSPQPAPQPSTSIVLDAFTSTRLNHDSPATPLWSAYVGGSCANGCANQTSTIANGLLTDVVGAAGEVYVQFNPYPYVEPTGFAHDVVASGAWTAATPINRLYLRFTPPASVAANLDHVGNMEFGTYTNAPPGSAGNEGEHYYHYFSGSLTAGARETCVVNNVPQHHVGTTGFADPNPTYGANPTEIAAQHPSSGLWDYFYGLDRFYVADEYLPHAAQAGTWTFEPVTVGYVTGEPDVQVSTLCAHYDGAAYVLTWQAGRNVVWTYAVYRLNVDGSLGAALGTASSRGDGYTGVEFRTPATAKDPTACLGVQPTGGAAFSKICPS